MGEAAASVPYKVNVWKVCRMVAAPTQIQISYHKDAEMLARAARLPFVAIGLISQGHAEALTLRLGMGLPLGKMAARVPTGEIGRAVRRILDASAAADRDRVDPEIKIDLVDGARHAVAWSRSERCLVAAWYPIIGSTPFVALVGPTGDCAFPRWQRELARLALMQESDRIHRERPPREGAEGEILGMVLETLTVPIAVVDRSARAVYCNAAGRALLGSRGPLRLSEGRVTAAPDVQKRLYAAIGAATNAVPPQSQVLVLAGDDTDGRLAQRTAVVMPVPGVEGMALIVCGSAHQPMGMLDLMLSELGLTPTERRLTERLVGGESLDDAAHQIGIKVTTARSYLRSVFEKTGASRQSELVSLALSLTPPTTLERPGAADAPPAPWRPPMRHARLQAGEVG